MRVGGAGVGGHGIAHLEGRPAGGASCLGIYMLAFACRQAWWTRRRQRQKRRSLRLRGLVPRQARDRTGSTAVREAPPGSPFGWLALRRAANVCSCRANSGWPRRGASTNGPA
eukprot:351697-Chlamydomonas_euryale.AAC.3